MTETIGLLSWRHFLNHFPVSGFFSFRNFMLSIMIMSLKPVWLDDEQASRFTTRLILEPSVSWYSDKEIPSEKKITHSIITMSGFFVRLQPIRSLNRSVHIQPKPVPNCLDWRQHRSFQLTESVRISTVFYRYSTLWSGFDRFLGLPTVFGQLLRSTTGINSLQPILLVTPESLKERY